MSSYGNNIFTDSEMRSLNFIYWIFLQKLIASQLVKHHRIS
jgi:hypothetical protein